MLRNYVLILGFTFVLISTSRADELTFDGKKVEFEIFTTIPTPLAAQVSTSDAQSTVARALARYTSYLEQNARLSSASQVDALYETFVRTSDGAKVAHDDSYKNKLVQVAQAWRGKTPTIVNGLVLKDAPGYVFFFVRLPNRSPDKPAIAGLKELGDTFYVTEDYLEHFPILIPLQQSALNFKDAQKRIDDTSKLRDVRTDQGSDEKTGK